MAQWHGISRRKPTGGRLKRPNRYRGKRRKEISSEKQYAFIGEEDENKVYRKHAGSTTVRVMQATSVNVNDPKTGKTIRSKITSVIENDAAVSYTHLTLPTNHDV